MGRTRTASRRRAQSGASGASGDSESWQAPSLTASERAYMIRKAKEASVALVDHAHTLDGPVQWHYTGKFRGIQMYRGEGSYDRVGTAGTEFLCGVTTMMGSIEEVASYFDQQTTDRMLAKKAEDVLDCGVLYALVQGDPNNPFYRVSAKYQLYEGPSAFSRERDYCFLECQNTFRHASGRRGWVLSMHSIKLPSCPEVDGVVRGSMYQSGYVFVEAEKEGYMDVMHSLQINFKSTSRLPHFLLNSALKRRILSVVTISREIQTSRMGRQTLLRKKDLMPKRARALCVNCSRKFSLFVRKTRCRVCGEVVCQPCAPQVMISTKRGPVKTRVCTKCYHLAPSDEYEPVGALPNTRNGSDPRRMQNETRYSDILQDHHEHPDMYHEEDEDSMEEDGDEDGLEEQSDYSVFAQSRFTDASRDSVATSQFGASSSNFESHFEGSSQFDTASELDDSQYYDGGVSENSFVSGTSTSYWQGGDSAASSMMGWKQASSVKPADGYIYDPQASMMSNGSNFYGASNYGSDYGASKYSVDEKPEKRPGRYKAAAAIPEDEPTSHRGYNISPNTSYNSNSDYSSTQGSNYNSAQVSDFKATQGTNYDASYASHNSNTSTESKTVSIQSLAKARSARYGIKSQFPPPPPPPPPLSPPPEEDDEEEEGDSPLHLGALKSDKPQSSKDRKAKGIAARKMFTPPPPKEGRREKDARLSANRASKVTRNMAFNAAVANRDSRVSQASSRDSRGFSNTRSSAILEQVRRNRGRTLQFTPESDRSSAVLKSLEEEHLNRMRDIERMQEVAKEKAARRSMASNGSRSSMQSAQSTQSGVRSRNDRASAAARKNQEQPRRSSRRSPPGSPVRPPPGSPLGAPPGSPPGTPPSMRGRRLPSSSYNSQANRSFASDRSRRTDANSDFGGSRFLSNRSNGAFVQSEDLMFNSQRSGFSGSKGSNSSSKGRRLDFSQGSSKSSSSSSRGRRLGASHRSDHSDDLTFDASQLSLDKSKFSSSIAILETPAESPEHVAMMERPSAQRSSNDSLLNEDLLNQSSVGMSDHINSMRARAAYKLPDEEDRPSDELQKRQEEHRRRMEELTKLTANHVVVEENIRDSSSTLGGLHDSSISLTGYSGNGFGDSTISSVSSASSVDIDDEEFDFETRPLGRTKRSGTIPFALEELEQVPDVEDDDEEQSEGPDDSDTSFRMSEEHDEHENKSEPNHAKPSYRSSEESVESDHKSTPEPQPVYRSSEDHKNVLANSLYRPSVRSVVHAFEQKKGLITPPYHPSEESANSAHDYDHKVGFVAPPCRASEESVEYEFGQKSGFVTPPRRSSVESAESEDEHSPGFTTPPRRSIEEVVVDEHESEPAFRPSEESAESEDDTGVATPPRRPSVESVEHDHEHELDHTPGFITPPRRSSVDEHERGFTTPPRRSSEESVEYEHDEHEHDRGFATPPRRSSEESLEHEYELEHDEHQQKSGFVTPPRRSSAESEEHEHESGFVTSPRRSSAESVEHEHDAHDEHDDHDEHEHKSGLVTPPRRSSLESVEHEYEYKNESGFATPPRRSSAESVELEDKSGIATQPRRSSEKSTEHVHEIGFATPPRRSSEDHGHKAEGESENARPSYRSSEGSVEHEHEQESEDLVRRSSEESVEHEHAEAAAYRTSEEFVEHKSDPEHVESDSDSSDESEPEDTDAAYRLSSEEPVAPADSAPKFQPHSSQLIPGEGGLAVDEFFADSSRVISSGKLPQVDEQGDDEDTRSPRDTSEFHKENLEFMANIDEDHTTQEFDMSKSKALISNSTFSTEMSEHVASPRASLRESCVSAIDEDLMNRPTNELFELVRANRPMYNEDGSRSSDMMHDMEASHMRRMEELNAIAVDHLGNRISNLDEGMFSSAYQPGRTLHPMDRDSDADMRWRSSYVMEEVQSKHQVDMERLRRRIRQLEEECRESIASVLTAEEMDLSELDEDDDLELVKKANTNGRQSVSGRKSFNPQTSFFSMSDLSTSSLPEHIPPQVDEPLPARVLFEQIAKLTELQRAMAEADDDDDEEEYRERIKEQYRVLQAIKAGNRQERASLASQDRRSSLASQERESLSDENWI